jgi:hypothetical protein
MIPEFAKWPSIQRLSSETLFITEKIDGTCGVIHIAEDGELTPGSRERWLLPGQSDNFGFGEWCRQYADELRKLGPGYHYGEWHGAGIQRKYGQPIKRFASFEFWRDDLPGLITKVPLLYEGPYTPTIFDETIEKLIKGGSVLYPGFMKPEGIVISFKNVRSAKFKKLCENDLIHKSQLPKEA